MVDPDSVAYLGLKDLAAKKRAEAAQARNTTVAGSAAPQAREYAAAYQARADINAAAEARKQAAAAAAAAAQKK